MGGTSGLGVTYLVKKGDTLWDIAEAELGSPWEWPRLYAFNNRDEVVRSGVRRITDPDLIYAGETIRIPRIGPKPSVPFSGEGRRNPVPVTRPEKLRDLLPTVNVPFAVGYDLSDVPEIAVKGPGYIARVQLKGNVTIELGQRVPLAYVLNRGLEASLKNQTDHVLGQLLSETTVTFDPVTKRASFMNKMVSQSNVAGIPRTAIGIAVTSERPLPTLRAEIEYPLVRGRIGGSIYLAQRLTVVVEIELDADQRWEGRRYSVPELSPAIRFGLVAAGVAVLVGTLAADVLSLGASLADDPITVPPALAMIGAGLGIYGAAKIYSGHPIRQSQ